MAKDINYGLIGAKIFAMLLIITSHIIYPGGVIDNIKSVDRYSVLIILRVLSLNCINIFGLITGYLSIKKLYTLLINVLIYSILISGIIFILNPQCISINYILNTLDIGSYWYVKCYALLFLLIPFINKCISSLNYKQYKKLLCIIVLIIIIPGDYFIINNGYSVWWLIILYVIGGFIARFPKNYNIKKQLIILTFNIFIMSIVGVLGFIFNNSLINHLVEYMFTYISPFVVLNSIVIFSFFKNLKINNNKIQNILKKINESIFYVYIIHFQFVLAWEYFIGKFMFLNKYSIILELIYILGIILFIFISCIFFDQFRILIQKNFKRIKTLYDNR